MSSDEFLGSLHAVLCPRVALGEGRAGCGVDDVVVDTHPLKLGAGEIGAVVGVNTLRLRPVGKVLR